MDERFVQPGSDGERPANLWRKGTVFTRRADMTVGAGYRISVAFKAGVFSRRPLVHFHPYYERVASVANQRVAELVRSYPRLAAGIECHGWRLLGPEGQMVTAFITLVLRSADDLAEGIKDEQPPSAEALCIPGGTSLDDLSRLAPQKAAECYSEFDFTDPSNPGSDPITVS